MLDVYGVERIEVLRGSPGTLYGKNTSAAAMTRNIAWPVMTSALPAGFTPIGFYGPPRTVSVNATSPTEYGPGRSWNSAP